jgi:uncharacterized protein (TIGR03790 family)
MSCTKPRAFSARHGKAVLPAACLLSRLRCLFIGTLAGLSLATGFKAQAGGSGLNTVVIVNQLSSNSCEVANYYCERRQVPPDNVLRISWAGGNIVWTSADFQTNLLNPLLTMLAGRQLTNQVDYVVLSMDIPYQTLNGTLLNGTTSCLFYGIKTDSGPGWASITNSYWASEQIFARARPTSSPGYAFLCTMITANSVAQAKQLIDQGVASDGTFPNRTVLLAKSSDPIRNIRYKAFDNAVFNTRLANNYSMYRTNCDWLWGKTNLLGFETGLANVPITPNTFAPGAMADSLTSFGGMILGGTDQTTLLAFINAGASGSYGTVTEPSAVTAKFPDPQNYFYQSRGFSLAECYYQSLYEPYEGLIVGEPLAAPYQRPGTIRWLGVSSNAVLSGTAQLQVQSSASDATRPLQQIDLFVDGKYSRTLTNGAPRPGNVLTVALNGYPISYTVPTNATLATLATGLASALNAPAVTNVTKAAAFVHGDRIELRATSTNGLADPFYFTDSSADSSLRFYRVVNVAPSSVPTLRALGRDANGAFRLHMEAPASSPCFVQASTDLLHWLPIYTNLLGGPLDFVDAGAAGLPRRFYRLAASLANNRPKLTPTGRSAAGGFKLHLDAGTVPYTVDFSTNFTQWTSIFTNATGGTLDFEDTAARTSPRRFYRAALVPQPTTDPAVTVVGRSANGMPLLRVDGAVGAYTIQASTDLSHWSPIYTNQSVGKLQAAVSTDKGSADSLSTFLNVSRGTFLDSPANGQQAVSINASLQIGNWVQLLVTKTNGVRVTLAITNLSLSATPMDVTTQLFNAINASLDLQGSDGVVADDLLAGWFGAATFNLRARSTGLAAGSIKLLLTGSANMVLAPAVEFTLTQNLSDLQPRNHLYVAAGATNLALAFPLDTTSLVDGFHELTAVAYEGSHVRTQARTTIPIRVQNSSLSATFTPLDFSDTAPVQGTYHIQVSANTNNVSAIRLFATGGQLDVVTNQPNATFTVNGSTLGAGLHPFYAIVETSAGGSYRTEKRWLRLLSSP